MSRKKSRAEMQSVQNSYVNNSHAREKSLKVPPFALKEAMPALALVRARPAPISLPALVARHQARQQFLAAPRPPQTAHPSLGNWQAGPSSGYGPSAYVPATHQHEADE